MGYTCISSLWGDAAEQVGKFVTNSVCLIRVIQERVVKVLTSFMI